LCRLSVHCQQVVSCDPSLSNLRRLLPSHLSRDVIIVQLCSRQVVIRCVSADTPQQESGGEDLNVGRGTLVRDRCLSSASGHDDRCVTRHACVTGRGAVAAPDDG
jgi:hypothetical protein